MSAFYGALMGATGWPASGGGGGETPPAWARAGSVADIDFVNDPPRAWTSTGGEVVWADFDTILGDSELFPGNAFDPSLIEMGVGYGTDVDVRGFGSFIGDLVTACNFDFTMVVEFNDIFVIEFAEAAFGTDLKMAYGPTQLALRDNGNDTLGVDLIMPNNSLGTAGAHKVAFTVTAASAYAAVDGTSLDDDDAPSTAIDPSTPNQPTDFVFNASKLKRLTVYNPIKTEAEQRTLTA